jgi:hypothetical protein
MKKRKFMTTFGVIAVALFFCLGQLVQAEESDVETLLQVKRSEITAKQFARARKIDEIRSSYKRVPKKKACKIRSKPKRKSVTAGGEWVLYESPSRNFGAVVRFPGESNPPLAIQTETITFPDGSMAHYTCHCEGADSSEDTCTFANGSDGKPDLNTCTGGECCGIVVHVIDADGAPIDTFPG